MQDVKWIHMAQDNEPSCSKEECEFFNHMKVLSFLRSLTN